MRCPRCRARNADRASSCSQCLFPFDAGQVPASIQEHTEGGAPQRDAERRPDPRLRAARRLRAAPPRPPATDDPLGQSRALAASLVLPGAGHLLAGKVGAGLVRALLFGAWVIGGVVLLGGARASNASALPALPLLGGAAVVWVTSAVDAVLVARGEPRQVLGPRPLLWLVVAVVGAVMMFFLAATVSVPAGALVVAAPRPRTAQGR